MANEKRLIDANEPIKKLEEHRNLFIDAWQGFAYLAPSDKARVDEIDNCIAEIINAPTVDAVPVDEIRVDIMSLSLENQEAILNVSICGKPNEVKLPFSKEVAEVMHGRWKEVTDQDEIVGEMDFYQCSVCGKLRWFETNYCPNCGAKMDGDGNG